MKSRAWMFILGMAVAAIVISCDELEETPQFVKSETDFTVTSSVATVAVTAADSLDAAITFTWNDPEYAVGLEQSKFTIKVASTGTNFVAFQTKEFTGVLTGSLSGKELNGIVLKLGGTIDASKVLDIMVVASQTNNNEPKNSNVVQVTVTPYGDLTLTPSTTSVVCSALTPDAEAISFSWNTAFNGFNGVKTYQLQYAAGGTSYASPTTIDITGFSKAYTHFDLNNVALSSGVSAGVQGTVDFRIKATNELGAVLYSNTTTISITTYVAFNSIGIIGDATAGGWSTDTDMRRPDEAKPTEWTVTAYLIGGKSMKFRADDGWTNNWGASGFPSGTGTQDGANIPIPNDAYYKIDFNVGTGAYTITELSSTVYTTIGILGDGAGGWSTDMDLTQDPDNVHIWTGTFTLTGADVKFRAENSWDANWGSSTFPSGFGTSGGANIPVSADGTYFVWFNDATGEYFFGPADKSTPYATVGVVGSAVGSWDNQVELIKDPSNPYKWSGNVELSANEAKFRVDNTWAVNWGSNTFPNGVGTAGGANIPVSSAGLYTVSFNSLTGEYKFVK